MSADRRLPRESEEDWHSSVRGHISAICISCDYMLWWHPLRIFYHPYNIYCWSCSGVLTMMAQTHQADAKAHSLPIVITKMSKWTGLMGSIWETMSALENVSGELTKDVNYSTSNNCERIWLGTGMAPEAYFLPQCSLMIFAVYWKERKGGKKSSWCELTSPPVRLTLCQSSYQLISCRMWI